MEKHWWHRLARLIVTIVGFGSMISITTVTINEILPETKWESHTIYSFEKTYDEIDELPRAATSRDHGFVLNRVYDLVFNRDQLKDEFVVFIPPGVGKDAFGRPLEGVSQNWRQYHDAIMNKLARDGFFVKKWYVVSEGTWRNLNTLWIPLFLLLVPFPLMRFMYRIILYIFLGDRLSRIQSDAARG